MQIRVFTLPLSPDSRQQEELNHFLRANKIIDIRKELAMAGGNSCRTFCVTYMQEAQAPPVAKDGKTNNMTMHHYAVQNGKWFPLQCQQQAHA